MPENIAEGLKPLLTDITTINPDKRNARNHPVRNLDAIKLSLETYGQRKPIVVNAANDMIEAGNGLYLAAVALGWTQIAVVYVNDDETTQKAYGLMDNQSALISEWDLPNLKDLLTELDTGGLDMAVTGFSADEIENLMTQTFDPKSGLTDDDAIPEKVETICKKGDLWKLGNHRLLCGDSTVITDVERLMGGYRRTWYSLTHRMG
jgi:ParB-like chromosome segregation protein Spo0J